MRVAHLLRKYNPAEWGGTETAIHQLFDGLRREGVDSIVYCPRMVEPLNVADPLADAGCTVQRFRACVPIWGISPEQRRQMISVGGNLMSFDLLRALWLAPTFSVIHSHALGRVGGIGLTIARRKRIPYVVTVHGGVYDLPDTARQTLATPLRGWEWGKPFGMLLRARRVLEEADAILTCNRREAELITRRHPDRLVMVQPHGVRTELYETDHRSAAREAFPQIRDREVVLSLGRIDAVKNQAWLVEQTPEIIRRHPRAIIVLAGACTDQLYGAALQRRITELGLGSHVLLTGKLPPADPRLIGLMQSAHVAVLQSISETFGLVILEAWAAGTPAVSSRTSGASSLIGHGRTGWLFDLDQPRSFHESIDALWDNAALRQQVAAAARARAVNDFDTRVLARQVKQLYERLKEEKNAHHHPA